jgi:alpha-amylase
MKTQGLHMIKINQKLLNNMLFMGFISSLTLALSACGGGSSAPTASFNTPVVTTPTTTTTTETPSANLPLVDISEIKANDPGSALPENWHKGVFMEIYVRGYKDSDGDGIGDLKGLIQSLDYLRDLGIQGIWLMPISQSEDKDHGYAVKDYRNIEAQYGSLADYDELIKQAHARGIGIILDYVMNHSANTHPLFVNSADTRNNAYRNWYVWQEPTPTGWNVFGSNPWYSTKNGAYFAAFYSGMPDFNLTNPSVVDFHQNNLRFWLNRGADGFRFDAVGNLIENGSGAWESQPESISLMGKIQQNIKSYKNRFLVCEAPGNPAAFSASTSCGNTFTFNNSNLIKASKGDATAMNNVAAYFTNNSLNMSTMLSNHDAFAGGRAWDELGGNIAQYKLAAATYLLQPGSPFIYYGEEIGLAGAANLTGDQKLRTPMSWNSNTTNAGFTTGKPFRDLSSNVSKQNVESQLNDPSSLYTFYKQLINLRNKRPSIQLGDYTNAIVISNVMIFQRQSGNEKTLVAINYGGAPASVSLSNLKGNAQLTSVFPNANSTFNIDTDGKTTININTQGILVFDLK